MNLKNFIARNQFEKLGVGVRKPSDPFFLDGNQFLTQLKAFGIYETDNEEFLHEPITTFSCNVLGCKKCFDTVFLFEEHYNLCHRYTCAYCKKTLATPHLLDLHVSEVHDSFFAVQAEKRPMFVCFSEDCKEIFRDSKERKEHCMKDHRFPSSFWSDDKPKKAKTKKDKPKKQGKDVHMNLVSEKQGTMEIEEAKEEKLKPDVMDVEKAQKKLKPRTEKVLGSAALGRKENTLFTNFTRDLAESLGTG